MKKIISLLLVLIMSFGMVACGADNIQRPSSGSEDISSSSVAGGGFSSGQQAAYDRELLALIENAVITTQPGTAGSSLKAVYAIRDILSWLKENQPDVTTMVETVKYFFENSEYAEDAKEAFLAMESAFKTITESEAAQQLLDAVQIELEELKLSDETIECIKALFEEIKNYTPEE